MIFNQNWIISIQKPKFHTKFTKNYRNKEPEYIKSNTPEALINHIILHLL